MPSRDALYPRCQRPFQSLQKPDANRNGIQNFAELLWSTQEDPGLKPACLRSMWNSIAQKELIFEDKATEFSGSSGPLISKII